MGIFSKSPQEVERLERLEAERRKQNRVMANAYSKSAPGDMLQALAIVYGQGGAINGVVSDWNHEYAERAMRSFINLITSTSDEVGP